MTMRATTRTTTRIAPANGAPQRPNRARRVTKRQLRELERELRGERARLERTLTSVAGAATPLMAARQGGFGQIADTDGGLPVLLKSRALGRLETLVSAIRRLEAGTYGLCLGCDGPIPFGRLVVMPEATHCIACGGRN